jgi:outer membrane protein assembly factor BamB
VWVHVEKTRFNSSMGGDGPRATPTISNNRVFAVGATGRLVCLDAATGKKLWGADLLADFGLKPSDNLEHGVCCSPLIDGDRVIVCPPCADGPCLVAYHRESGHKLWQTGSLSASYSSPTLWEVEGVRQILLFTRDALCGFDANTGKELWKFAWSNHYRVNVAQPIPDAGGRGAVLLSTGYNTGATRLFIKLEGPDRWTVSQDWKRNVLKTKFTSAVVFENHAYGLDDGILTCVDIANGKAKWKDGRYKHGQVILVGDRLIVQDEFGEVIMVDASPAKWRELGRVRGLRGEHGEEHKSWNVPVMFGKYLIVRNDREMVCYELAQR